MDLLYIAEDEVNCCSGLGDHRMLTLSCLQKVFTLEIGDVEAVRKLATVKEPLPCALLPMREASRYSVRARLLANYPWPALAEGSD